MVALWAACGTASDDTLPEPPDTSEVSGSPVASLQASEPGSEQVSNDTLEESIDGTVEQFRVDLANNAMRMIQHTIWVLMDETVIKDWLANVGVELVGDVILGADHGSSGIDIWGVETPPMSGGQAYVGATEDKLIVAFRSTASDDGWEVTLNVLTDLRALPKKIEFIDDSVPNAEAYRKLKVHAGFHNEYLRYRDRILEYVSRHPDKDIYLTGHSLGGALAVLSSFDIAAHTQRPVTVFTFGQPRVGGSKFREAYDKLVPNSYRVVVDGDPIARIPGMLLNYEHVGKLLQLNGEGSQLAPEEIQSSAFFQVLDFPKHILPSYYGTLNGLHTSCEPSASQGPPQDSAVCLNVGWLIRAAEAERESAKKAWEVVPEGTIPWQSIRLDKVPIEKIPVDKLPTEFPAIELPPWKKIIPIDHILINKIPIDEIPIDKLPIDKLPADIFLKGIPEIPLKKKLKK